MASVKKKIKRALRACMPCFFKKKKTGKGKSRKNNEDSEKGEPGNVSADVETKEENNPVQNPMQMMENPMLMKAAGKFMINKKNASELAASMDSKASSAASSEKKDEESKDTGGSTLTLMSAIFGKDLKRSDDKKDEGGDENIDAEDALTVKCGWLYRQNELCPEGNFTDQDPIIKKWVTVCEKRMVYCPETDKPAQGHSVIAEGYIDLGPKTTVKFTHLDRLAASTSVDTRSKYCFIVKEPNDTENSTSPFSITWSCETEAERNHWVDTIRGAINGVSHPMSRAAMLKISAVQEDDEEKSGFSIELPRKIGVLKKYAVGGFMGVKTIKTRWFRLDGGELRYYASEDMRPIKLKGTISLREAVLLDSVGCGINIQIGEDSAGAPIVLIMEATTPKIAKEWKDAFEETLLALRVRGFGSSHQKRRQNLADISNSKKKKVKDPTKGISTKEEEDDDDDDDNNNENEGNHGDRAMGFAAPDMDSRSKAMITDCLKQHFLMKTLKDLGELIHGLKKVTKLPGDIIICQGSAGDYFYILETGSADVQKDGNKIGRIPSGRAFGDLALLNSSARTATVKASQVCHLWILDRQRFRSILAKNEKIEMKQKMVFLRSVKLFEQISDYSLEKIADVMQMVSFNPKERIFKQGESGERFFMVQTGRVSIYLPSITRGNTELVRLGPGKFFGELALLDNAPRKASASAIERTTCWTVDRNNFCALLGSIKEAENESIGVNILKKVTLMNGLSEKSLIAIARCLTTVEFTENDAIIEQGEDGDTFFMIAAGQVKVEVNHVEVAQLGDNAFFGEMALMKNEKRSATVTALADTVCLSLARTDFNRLLGPIVEEIKEQSAKRAVEAAANKGIFEQLEEGLEKGLGALFSDGMLASGLSGNVVEEQDYGEAMQSEYNKLFDLDQLDRVHIIGRGTFSNVYLVKHTANDTYYALKVMFKDTLLKTNQCQAVFMERDLMKMFDDSFVTTLYATFQDKNCLYMVMNYIPGGDLFSLIQAGNPTLNKSRIGGLQIDAASFYTANLIYIMQVLNNKDIVFRDLKPENFALASTGYLSILDFGSAKMLIGEETTNTMVGTPEYLAPEVITSKGHAKGVDIWALGIMVYEILTTKTPFEHANSAMIYQNIIESEEVLRVSFTKEFDIDAKDFIMKLLVVNPHMRLGMLRNGLDDLWAHPFLANSRARQDRETFAHNSIMTKEHKPPFKPADSKSAGNQRTHLDDLVIGNFDSDVTPDYQGKFDFSHF